jgi:hypothetical protein
VQGNVILREDAGGSEYASPLSMIDNRIDENGGQPVESFAHPVMPRRASGLN